MNTRNSELTDTVEELDPPYESNQELQIGRMLDSYGIPFFYRQPAIVYDGSRNQILKPSFTILGHGQAVVDYVPRAEERISRNRLYRYNQIPAVVLGPRSLAEPNWQERLYEELLEAGRKQTDLSAYLVSPNLDRYSR